MSVKPDPPDYDDDDLDDSDIDDSDLDDDYDSDICPHCEGDGCDICGWSGYADGQENTND